MVLQRKAFCVQGKITKLEEISYGEYEKMKMCEFQVKVFIMHKLAFGPAFKSGITPPSLFFHLSKVDLIPFPPKKSRTLWIHVGRLVKCRLSRMIWHIGVPI
jgi:hypothetical protein